MGIGVDGSHEDLRTTARQVLTGLGGSAPARALLDVESTPDLPPTWAQLADLGWLGLAIDEEHGGSGLSLLDLAVVVEELGRFTSPGPVVPTMLAAQVLQRWGTDEQRKALLPGLVDGSTPATVGLGGIPRISHADADGLVISGDFGPVVSAHQAELLVLPVAGGRFAIVPRGTQGLTVTELPSLDATRRSASVTADQVRVPGDRTFTVTEDRLLETAAQPVRDLALVLAAAEACGSAGWCLETTADYAKVRVQFGRPIGMFQAVKHKCSNMLVALEQARAAVWDAARAPDEELPVAVAGALTITPAVSIAKDAVQLLGGIGYTWEHDVHLHLKRAVSQQAVFGKTSTHRARVIDLARSGTRRKLALELPPEAEELRLTVRAELERYKAMTSDADKVEWMASWLAPHWPKPYGQDAGALEQLVIDEECKAARVRRPHLAVGGWALPTIIAHGTPEQQERFVVPGLRGQITWCQMFSEPGAGSDLAALSTKAVKTDGGWSITGQKVWTSLAQWASHAILLARTSSGEDRRQGITYFVLDMKTPGIDIRPLRELTGAAMFNEVFLDEVFVPDDCVIGDVGDGWRLARTTLANERVSMGAGNSFGSGVEQLLKLAPTDDALLADELGGLVVEAQSLALLGLRMTLKQLSGAEPGTESSVRKLIGAEHDQRVQELGMTLLDASVQTGASKQWTDAFLATRCMTIAGGTSEVQRNVVAERLLGLPRDAA